MRQITFLLLLLSIQLLHSQDTLKVMHYNLLEYGNVNFCNNTNNNTDLKNVYMRAICEYVMPDIITINEIRKDDYYHNLLYNDAILAVNPNYGMGAAPLVPEDDLSNQLFYNKEKLALLSQEVVQDYVREIDLYTLYYLSDGLEDGDTVFIHCIVAHLKAGDDYDDKQDRATMVENTLEYLENFGRTGNYLYMGDFNFYTSSEPGFQKMITNNDAVFRFYDPADAIGSWNNNNSFRHVHTQCTRVDQTGCGAYGGMDDRFDFIMINQAIMDESDHVSYLEGSYWALGQDGDRFNGSIIDPPNNSIPAYIGDALFGMSDHLPVVMDLVVDENLSIQDLGSGIQYHLRYNNPVTDELKIYFTESHSYKVTISLISVSGVEVYREERHANDGSVSIATAHLPVGMYILKVASANEVFTSKVLKVK